MSTPLLSPKRFADLQRSLIHHATNEHSPASCSMLNGELFRAFGVHPFDHEKPCEHLKATIKAAVFDWQRANYNAHVVRYELAPVIPGAVPDERPPAPTPRLPAGALLNAPALLKALRALRYNCDGGEASGQSVKESLELLDRVINALKDYCLELLPEYRDAEWAI